MRTVIRVFLVLMLLCAIGAAAGYVWLRQSLPQLDGTVTLSGLKAPVDIVRDRHGVPHIYAGSVADAYFALGFVHAQDRLWQMEMNPVSYTHLRAHETDSYLVCRLLL